MKKISTILTIVVLFAFAIVMVNQPDSGQAYAKQNQIHVEKNTGLKQIQVENIKREAETNDITHEEIVKLTDTFMDLLVQEIDDHYKVVRFDTKEELINAFEPYIVKEAVQPYIDYYYKEKEDGLYIVPTETPPWFEKDEDYEKKSEGNKVTITQSNESALYGMYTIEIVFKKMDGTWKIANISHK
ncbi:hypothetical protein SAMN04487943_12146 [Gracilibacillus orientalis]|uniref:DUF3993 domain-containing protein n=1 Tax=Gracilibacillus orientalis TaxID=334253 RepID=A0A1I4R8S9_9BACI|nr:hypothetical protein [Gracilibacillus orientalis]SFM48360.1 hypothetical protein SAMN04487943_12146 [Gracilibacillus orientalis]